MSKLKLFAGTAVWVPHTWKERVHDGPHSQLDVAIVATSKSAAVDMLVAAGESRNGADAIIRACKWQRDHMSDPIREMVAGEVLDLKQPGVYVWKSHVMDRPVARVDVDGMPIVGHFRLKQTGRGVLGHEMYAEPA